MEANRPRLTCSVTEMALMLGISRSKAYACVRTGEVKSIRIGRRVVVPRRVIDELLGSGAELESAAAEPAAERAEGGVETADLLDSSVGQAGPGEDVEHADRRALHSGVLGGDLRQRVGEEDQRHLAPKRTRRRGEGVEADGAGIVGQLLATGPVVAGQLSLFDVEGGPHVGRGRGVGQT